MASQLARGLCLRTPRLGERPVPITISGKAERVVNIIKVSNVLVKSQPFR